MPTPTQTPDRLLHRGIDRSKTATWFLDVPLADRPLAVEEVYAARVERRIGRRLTTAESKRVWYAKTNPSIINRRGELFAQGYRLMRLGTKLEMVRNGRTVFGTAVAQ